MPKQRVAIFSLRHFLFSSICKIGSKSFWSRIWIFIFNVQNLFSWQWLCLDLDKDWCLRKVELKITRTHIEQITAKAVIHSGGNVMMTWWQQNFKQITMCLKPLWLSQLISKCPFVVFNSSKKWPKTVWLEVV